MNIDIQISGKNLLVRPAGEIDIDSSDKLRLLLDNAMDDNPVCHMVVNLEGVTYIDSSGLGVLLGRYKRLAATGGRVSLVSPGPRIRKILEISGLLRIMGQYETEEEAISKAV